MEPVLIQAAKGRENALLRNLLLDGIDPDTEDGQGETALTWASYLGHTAIVKDLLAAGADLEQRGGIFRSTPLILAAHGGYRGIVALLSVRSDLDAVDFGGATALMMALENSPGWEKPIARQIAILKILIESGAKLDIQDQRGETALMYAVRGKNRSAMVFLCEAGADPRIPNYQGETPAERADICGDVETLGLLRSYMAGT